MRRSLAPLVAALLAVSLAGCSSAADPADADPADTAASTEAGGSTDASVEPTEDEATDEATDSGGAGYTAEDVGTGTVEVDGVTYDGIAGDCEVYNNYGADLVGSMDDEGIDISIGVDNVSSGLSSTDVEMSFVAISRDSFRLRGIDIDGSGAIESATLVEPRTDLENVQYAELILTGTTDDGRGVVASLVCDLAKP